MTRARPSPALRTGGEEVEKMGKKSSLKRSGHDRKRWGSSWRGRGAGVLAEVVGFLRGKGESSTVE